MNIYNPTVPNIYIQLRAEDGQIHQNHKSFVIIFQNVTNNTLPCLQICFSLTNSVCIDLKTMSVEHIVPLGLLY